MMELILFSAPFGIEAGQYTSLAVIPNYLLVLGAILLWLAFMFLGIIARRYEIVLGERTNWQFMVFAPTGILIFAIIQLSFCGVGGKMMLPKGGVDYVAYGLFLVSGILSLLSSIRFYGVTKSQ
jgi:hypothetical protein